LEQMRAMVLRSVGQKLELEERKAPLPGPGEIRIKVEACGICRTDLHIIDGDLYNARLPVIPGHEIVGRVDALGQGVSGHSLGSRVGIPWLGGTCGHCSYCIHGAENLCDDPTFTGYDRDGGFATHTIVDAAYVFAMDLKADPVSLAPLLCAGLIGWRSLKRAGEGRNIGIYGFGAAAHLVAQVCRAQGRNVFAFTREGDEESQAFARELGAVWAGSSSEPSPESLDAAIIFAPVGDLVPRALRSVRKGGRVVCGGIHMSDIPSFPYDLLWMEREIVSVANLTRADAREFLNMVSSADVQTHTVEFRLEDANEAIEALRAGQIQGAAVLVP
jgi:propanol-preferring alcohol dehydrogenase